MGGDGAVGEGEITGRESGEGAATEVHDHLDQARELRVSLQPPPHLVGEEDEQAAELLVELIGRGRGAIRWSRGRQRAAEASAEAEVRRRSLKEGRIRVCVWAKRWRD